MQHILIALRPRQWIKNLFVLAALFFVKAFSIPDQVERALIAVGLFCLASSAGYIINDIIDLPADRLHPTKRFRPLAAGLVSIPLMAGISVCLVTAALLGGFWLNTFFGWSVASYLLLQLLYSCMLKHMVIIDVIAIAAGFVIRVVAGAFAILVSVSPWLIFCTFFLTLFMAICKRRSERALQGDMQARVVFGAYSVAFLDQMNTMVLPLTVVTYTFYTFSSEHSRLLMLTVPIVLYGLFRYLLVVLKETEQNDGPTDILFSDRGLQYTVGVWVLAVFLILIFHG